ncbi:MAG: hypothetical protein LBC65_00650, partial [Oscillospiraceae bacterium]|nr:hypothetical protein [Oscillospiraceae bacterium]
MADKNTKGAPNGESNRPMSNNVLPQRQAMGTGFGFGPGSGRGGGGGGGGGIMSRLTSEKPKDGKRTLLRLIKYLGRNIPALLSIFVFSILSVAATITATRLSGTIVDEYIKKLDVR